MIFYQILSNYEYLVWLERILKYSSNPFTFWLNWSIPRRLKHYGN